jgi:hypothetical protein
LLRGHRVPDLGLRRVRREADSPLPGSPP